MDVEVLKFIYTSIYLNQFIYTYLKFIDRYIYKIKLGDDLFNLNVGGDLIKI